MATEPIDQLLKPSEIYALADADEASREKPLPRYVEMNNSIRYKVIGGDFLGKIANKFGVRVSQIKQWNGLRNNNLKNYTARLIHKLFQFDTVFTAQVFLCETTSIAVTFNFSIESGSRNPQDFSCI